MRRLDAVLKCQKVPRMQQNHTKWTHETYETGCEKPKPKNHTMEILDTL
jgi:hypothetical protein